MGLTRRALLGASGLAAAATVPGWSWTCSSRAWAAGAGLTTLDVTTIAKKATGYSRLAEGPGQGLLTRTEACDAKAGREDRRVALASLVQLTDLHFVDAQSPMRLEWLHPVSHSAFRPQEALGTQANAALVAAINRLAVGPHTGRRFDAVVVTGDNTDNCEEVELDWYLTTLSGGTITPTTGDPARWEGVQTRNNPLFWTPESPLVDRFKQVGFPQIDGYFARATASHASEGLKTPWYAVFGNHDDSIQGTLPSRWKLKEVYTGDQKLEGFADVSTTSLGAALRSGTAIDLGDAKRLTVTVTPDARRRPVTPVEFMKAHLDPAVTGPGPVGHGFTPESLATGRGYYTFQIAPGVTGISLDSTNRAGWTEGSIDHVQWQWLIEVLKAGSPTWYDAWGTKHTHDVAGQLFFVFSHHTSGTMNNLTLPGDGTGIRHVGSELAALLGRFPTVIAWVNGHTHANAITLHGHDDPLRRYWEVNTASHIDHPQQARVLELVDNADDTLSLLTTMVESQVPLQVSHDASGVAAMASLSREFAWNDPGRSTTAAGSAADTNTELLLRHPLR